MGTGFTRAGVSEYGKDEYRCDSTIAFSRRRTQGSTTSSPQVGHPNSIYATPVLGDLDRQRVLMRFSDRRTPDAADLMCFLLLLATLLRNGWSLLFGR